MRHRFTIYHRDDTGVVLRKGIFFRRLTEWQATALIMSGTIGAGILGIPYVVAKVGIGIGLFFIVAVGICMIGFNLLLGEVAVRTNHQLQLSGFAKKYLGRFGEVLMTVVVYSILYFLQCKENGFLKNSMIVRTCCSKKYVQCFLV